jgi:hypothetical protein
VAWSSSAWTVSPVLLLLVVVAAMVSTITSWLVNGLPRQFIEMWENKRCSIWGEMRPPDPDFGRTSLRAVRVSGAPLGQ